MITTHPARFDPTAPNESTRDAWQSFSSHRARIRDLLAKGEAGRLTVLGAGNCNDLDLPEARDAFGQVELVDLDRAALTSAVARQTALECTIRAPIDVSGLGPAIQAHPRDFDALLAEVGQPRVGLELGQSSTVLSACVLSQINAVACSLRLSDPRTVALLRAIRVGHVALMLSLLQPGGVGILVHDMVSSDTAPAIRDAGVDLEALSRSLVSNRNYLHGGNPDAVGQTLSAMASSVERVRPWLWNISETRAYLVHAYVFRA